MNDRGGTGESHVVRLFKFVPPMCSVHSRTGQLACPATHAASCSAADGRRSASARSVSIGSIMRAPSHAIDHHRSKPSPEPILPRATKRGCYCGMLVAATTDPRRAALARMTSLWPSCSPTLIRRPEVPCTPEKGSNRPCTSSLARISGTAQSVRASDTSNCRYQHPPAPWQTSKGKRRTPWYSSRKPKVPPVS